MTIVYRCHVCGYPLYVHRIGQGRAPPTPSEIIYMYGGRCPRCGALLRKPGIEDVLIIPRTAVRY